MREALPAIRDKFIRISENDSRLQHNAGHYQFTPFGIWDSEDRLGGRKRPEHCFRRCPNFRPRYAEAPVALVNRSGFEITPSHLESRIQNDDVANLTDAISRQHKLQVECQLCLWSVRGVEALILLRLADFVAGRPITDPQV